MTRNEEITGFLYQLKNGVRIPKVGEDVYNIDHFIKELITVGLVSDGKGDSYELTREGRILTNSGKTYDDFLKGNDLYRPTEKSTITSAKPQLNPREKVELIHTIAEHLLESYEVKKLRDILEGYGFANYKLSFLTLSAGPIEKILKSQPNDEVILQMAYDLGLDKPETTNTKTNVKVPKNNNTNKSTKKIFISHSSRDKDLVEKIIDLLRVIGVSHDKIFCSSFEGYNIELGHNFLDAIKRELSNDVLVLFVLSKNFYESPFCMCEMGAAWVTTKEHVSILIPPFTYADVNGVLPHSQGMPINNKEKLSSLKEKLEKFFGLSPIKYSIWERDRNNIVDIIEQRLRGRNPVL